MQSKPSTANEPIHVKERFSKIYSEYIDSIFRYCLLKVSDRDIAIDLAHDVFTKYWDSLIQGMIVSHDKAFLFTIARNRIIDWYRRKKPVSLDALQEQEEWSEGLLPGSDNAKGALEMDTESRFLISKIRELSATAQQVLYLRYIEDLKPKEISDILHIKESAVSVRIHRGLNELRKVTGYEIR